MSSTLTTTNTGSTTRLNHTPQPHATPHVHPPPPSQPLATVSYRPAVFPTPPSPSLTTLHSLLPRTTLTTGQPQTTSAVFVSRLAPARRHLSWYVN
ncbi:hypothetical protein E2C01_098473 [Portunus trituberculatus]|uniref:Uncharacterized protein n=1 Tax=Portunus trituberculatus TaxID=210409 RepID=A0A5B7K8H3_PORTR|nr:hypothetical protein [Portunus trituberculatus]